MNLKNTISCSDCLSHMNLIESDYIDLTVTSPPYDNIRDYHGYNIDINLISIELYRITKIGGVVVWVVNDQTIDGSESLTSFKTAINFVENGWKLHDTMIFLKNSFTFPETTRYHQVFEYMFIFSKGKPKTFNPLMDRKNKYTKMGGISGRNKDGTRRTDGNSGAELNEYGKRFNVWNYIIGGNHVTGDKFAYEHPAIFPESLAQDHILSWSNEGDIIYDPFCGSGTTLKMAKLNKRIYIGCDISEKYCEISKKRVNSVYDVFI